MNELSTLLVDNNKIQNLSALANLTNLKGIYANNNLIGRDNTILQFQGLVDLYLFDNNLPETFKAEVRTALPNVNLEL